MNTAHKQSIPTLLPPGQVQTGLGLRGSQALPPSQLLGCTHCAESAIWILGKLWNWNMQDSWLSLTAISVLTPRCLREALLQSSSLSETSARSFPQGQA